MAPIAAWFSMPIITVPRLLITGISAGVGKSLVATGLTVALRKRGLSVSCCVTATDLHQAVLFQRMSRRYVRTLDQRFLSPEMIRFNLYQASLGADVVLMDGSGGLHDGFSVGVPAGSDAEIARITETPTVMLVPDSQFGESLAALVAGYDSFRGGRILNALILSGVPGVTRGTTRGYQGSSVDALNAVLSSYQLPNIFGDVPWREFAGELPGRGFSQGTNVTALPAQFFHELGTLVEESVDIDGLLRVAATAPELELPEDTDPPRNRSCRMAIANDGCFSVGFQDNIDALRYYGAELVGFSPLADQSIPEGVTGVYLPGAYLASYAEELSMNVSLRDSMRDFVERGGLLMSEGAATAFLSRSFQVEENGEVYEGAGVLPFDSTVGVPCHQQVELNAVEDSILGPVGTVVCGVRTEEFMARGPVNNGRGLSLIGEIAAPVGSAPRSHLVSPEKEGFSPTAQSFCTYMLLHLGATPRAAKTLVESAALARP